MIDLIKQIFDFLVGLDQGVWNLINATIFFVTAWVIWRQLSTAARNASLENFRKINDALRDRDMRTLRRALYTKGADLEMSTTMIDFQEGGGKVENDPYMKRAIDEMKAFIGGPQNEERIRELIVIFDAMGLMISKGGSIKAIMLDMYWDVIIKSWDCLYPIIYTDREAKEEHPNRQQGKAAGAVSWATSRLSWKYISKRFSYFVLRYIRLKGNPARKGYHFKPTDFVPGSTYRKSHYENFEILARHAEWYGWKRGISRPILGPV